MISAPSDQNPRCSPRCFTCSGPASIGSDRLREFVEAGGLSVWLLRRAWLTRAFELMEVYAGHPMDLADASLVTAAEAWVRGESSRSIARTSRLIACAVGIATRRWRSSHDTSIVASCVLLHSTPLADRRLAKSYPRAFFVHLHSCAKSDPR